MRAARRVALLVVIWLLAWGEVSLANVLSGVAVAVALLAVFPARRTTARHGGISAVGVVRLAGYVVAQLLVSNLVMAREIVRRRPRMRPGVLAHRLQAPSEDVVTVMTSVIALSPGTMTVDADLDSSTVYVHFLLLSDVDAARAALVRLERLVTNAIAAPRAGDARTHLEEKP
jgi:multicomponent Na+:H+ antiporter subunit E